MDVFDYINRKLRDTFAYFKSRTKAKYEGDRFEEGLFPIQIFRRTQRNQMGNLTGDL